MTPEIIGHLTAMAAAINKILDTNIIGSEMPPPSYMPDLFRENREIREKMKSAQAYFDSARESARR